MTYRIRVSLPGIKGFARVYELAPKNTLYAFHKRMLSDMEFPPDQVVLFKGFDANGGLVAKYATFDLGQGSIEHITIAHVVDAGIASFVYFYDTTNRKSVILTIEGEGCGTDDKPALIESKGPIPEEFLNGYVAFEDLPPEKRRAPEEDDDFDDEGDDDEEDGSEEDDDFAEEYGEDEADE